MKRSRGQVGPRSGGSRTDENAEKHFKNSLNALINEKALKNEHLEPEKLNGKSYRNVSEAASALVAKTETTPLRELET